jgi:hypothetical protein
MLTENEPEWLLIKHKRAQQLLDCSNSFYWSLVRKGLIKVRGRGKAGRATYESVKAYAGQAA